MKSQKVTQTLNGSSQFRHGRWYGDACGTAYGLELVGERWTLLVMRELMLGGRRFSDLRASLPGISARVLTERLTSLEAAGIVERQYLPAPASAKIYALTAWGCDAEAILAALGRWAARSPGHDVSLPISPVSVMLSLRTMFDAEAAHGLAMSVGLTIGRESFLAELADGALPIRRAGPDEGELGLAAPTPHPLLAVIYGGVDPAEAAAGGAIALRGDIAAIRRFASLFSLPEKVA